jgi:hypothetical protein
MEFQALGAELTALLKMAMNASPPPQGAADEIVARLEALIANMHARIDVFLEIIGSAGPQETFLSDDQRLALKVMTQTLSEKFLGVEITTIMRHYMIMDGLVFAKPTLTAEANKLVADVATQIAAILGRGAASRDR